MTLRRWKKLRLIEEIKNPWWTYRTEQYQLPSGATGTYHVVHTNGSSLIIPLLDDGRILLVRQYRYLCDRESLEFPCGSVKDGSTYEETARLELEEEGGYIPHHLKEIGTFNPYNGVTDECCKIYLATRLSPIAAPPDETEELESVALPPTEIDQKIERGEIWDGMTIAAWFIGRNNLNT